MRYIGLDVHKNNTTACIIANNGKPVTIMDVRSDEVGLQNILDYMDGQELPGFQDGIGHRRYDDPQEVSFLNLRFVVLQRCNHTDC